MDSQEVLSLYESVAEITHQMLDAARAADWELLVELESRCSSQVAVLKREEPHVPMTGDVREHKVRIIRKILEDDREIRDITTPWMTRLSALLNSTSAERKLAKAYGGSRSG